MAKQYFRVVKVGGSLFDLPDMGKRIRKWLKKEVPGISIFVAGGGELVEAIRRMHAAEPMSEERAHHLCMDAMDMMAHILHQRLPRSSLCGWLHQMRQQRAELMIFQLGLWLSVSQRSFAGTPLPESWDVTSDSIAARVAICTGADELVLLKSADPPSRDLQELADCGYVDKFLPKLGGELPPWRCVNLRAIT
jgi:aspartokinase-like uncharacterized kinase